MGGGFGLRPIAGFNNVRNLLHQLRTGLQIARLLRRVGQRIPDAVEGSRGADSLIVKSAEYPPAQYPAVYVQLPVRRHGQA